MLLALLQVAVLEHAGIEFLNSELPGVRMKPPRK